MKLATAIDSLEDLGLTDEEAELFAEGARFLFGDDETTQSRQVQEQALQSSGSPGAN